jgi:hypothetical protein
LLSPKNQYPGHRSVSALHVQAFVLPQSNALTYVIDSSKNADVLFFAGVAMRPEKIPIEPDLDNTSVGNCRNVYPFLFISSICLLTRPSLQFQQKLFT